MVNRRYALLGWLVWQLGKRAAKRRARALTTTSGGRSLNPALIVPVGVALAAAAAAWFFFRGRDGGEPVE
jgi:hypothetical protein